MLGAGKSQPGAAALPGGCAASRAAVGAGILASCMPGLLCDLLCALGTWDKSRTVNLSVST